MFRAPTLLIVLFACVVTHPDTVSGQVTGIASDPGAQETTPVAERFGPSASSALMMLSVDRPAAERAEESTRPLAPGFQVRNRRGVPYMVAGGILFVAGAIAGGDAGGLLMLGGAGVGAYGAYIYYGGG